MTEQNSTPINMGRRYKNYRKQWLSNEKQFWEQMQMDERDTNAHKHIESAANHF